MSSMHVNINQQKYIKNANTNTRVKGLQLFLVTQLVTFFRTKYRPPGKILSSLICFLAFIGIATEKKQNYSYTYKFAHNCFRKIRFKCNIIEKFN